MVLSSCMSLSQQHIFQVYYFQYSFHFTSINYIFSHCVKDTLTTKLTSKSQFASLQNYQYCTDLPSSYSDYLTSSLPCCNGRIVCNTKMLQFLAIKIYSSHIMMYCNVILHAKLSGQIDKPTFIELMQNWHQLLDFSVSNAIIKQPG